MSAPDDDVPSGETFERMCAMVRAKGADEYAAVFEAALMLVAWMIARSDEAATAKTITDLRPKLDQVHRQLDQIVELMRFHQAPQRGRP